MERSTFGLIHFNEIISQSALLFLLLVAVAIAIAVAVVVSGLVSGVHLLHHHLPLATKMKKLTKKGGLFSEHEILFCWPSFFPSPLFSSLLFSIKASL